MADNSLLDQKTSLVGYQVKIDGTAVPDDLPIVFISVSKSLNKISTAKIEIDNGDSYNAEFSVIEDKTYECGRDVEILLGYQTQTDLIFKGKIVKHGVKISSNNSSKIVLECADESIVLTGQREFEIFEDMKDSDIIQQIAGDKGISVTCASTDITHQRVVQHNSTGWDIIITRAQANYLVALTDGGELKLVKPGSGAKTELKVVYGENINSMDVSIDARSQLLEVGTSAWDYSNQSYTTGTSKEPSEVDKLGNIKGKDIADSLGYKKTKLHSTGKMESDELNKWAESTLLISRLSRVKGTIKTQGFAKINPNDFLKIESVGKYFDGDAYVSGVYHEQKDGNWLTEITLGIKPELFVSSKKDITLPISDGLFPGYTGLFIGIVKEIHEDPDGESRVLVNLPLLGSEIQEGVWARCSHIMASSGYGAFFMPEVEDEVILGALGGDLRFPIILGHLYSSGRNYADGDFEDHNQYNNHKGWKTRSGMLFHFDDDQSIIKLETPGGQKLKLDDADSSIILEDQHGNEIKMDRDGISITSCKDFKVTASAKIEQNSGGNSTYSASGNYEAAGGVKATLKTGGNGKVVINGPIVNLN